MPRRVEAVIKAKGGAISTNNNMFFRKDSSEPLSNLNSNEDNTSFDTLGDNWIEVEQASRVLMLIDKRIKEIGYDDDVLTCDDWESIFSF
ncbi:uncharacterized protein BX663DRAFT_549460 [Cokeromyces recurvatus]|uniref:uncharacterized protein n=1 Tax=Cokeromyces recurvatus TaxID=90255 RepID=UPI002220B58C|nr:uncharacterized protein BX663DRAFT_549460 [Cokeromyces recurvatus]KAI7905461.1 hypothetical protein BX663DRAFT_549460 [Cokeromyces recurvatus]